MEEAAPRRPPASATDADPDSWLEACRPLLEALPAGVAILDSGGRIVHATAELCRLTEFAPEDLLGTRAPYPFWIAEGADPAVEAALEALDGSFEAVLARKDDSRFAAQVDVRPAAGGRGAVLAIRDIGHEVRERERLAASEAALREVQEIAGVATWEWDPVADRVLLSERLHGLSGIEYDRAPTLEEVLGLVAAEHRESLLEAMRGMLRGGEELVHRFKVEVPNAALTWLETRARSFRDTAGRLVRVVGTVQDVSEPMDAAEDARLRARLLDEVDAAVVATDLEGVVTHWNNGAQKLYGWSRQESLGRPIADFVLPGENAARLEQMSRSVLRQGRWEGELEICGKDGGDVPVYLRSVALEDRHGTPIGRIGVAVDVSSRRSAERELRSARDYLRSVTDSMGDGLCTVDVTGRIQYVNGAAERTLGWTLDELRGRRLHETTHYKHADGSPYPPAECPMVRSRTRGELVRVEDDVFFRKDGTAVPVAYTSAPIDLGGGVKGAVIVFRDITARKREQARIERELDALSWLARIRDALERDRFTLYAQPIIDVASGETVQHELLIRMLEDDGTVIVPGAFLPYAEQYGLIREIDRWVIRQAARLAGRGRAVELNLSAVSLGDSDLIAVVERELRDAGADPKLVVIEITETGLLANEDVGRAFIERVEQLGCQVALDDFGTGYGGFTYVKRLPVHFLKIDMEFVGDLRRNAASRHVVRAIVQLARDFGQQTVAEGVEDRATLDLLRDLGVDYAQGYAIGRPAPLEDMAAAGAPRAENRRLV